MHDLPLQIGEVDRIVVADGERADARRGEIHSRRRAESSRADDEGARRSEFLLSFDADLRQQDMPAVTQELIVVHGASAFRVHRTGGVRCGTS
jgi:hypothetical protein